MRHTVLRPLAVMSALTVGISCSAGSEPVTVRQNLLSETRITSDALNGACTSQHPTLKTAFDHATAEYQSRISSVLDALLETEDFKSLSQARAPESAIGLHAPTAALLRNTTFSLDDCNRILDDTNGVSDETLKGIVMQMLAAQKGMIEMEKRRKE